MIYKESVIVIPVIWRRVLRDILTVSQLLSAPDVIAWSLKDIPPAATESNNTRQRGVRSLTERG